MRIFLPEKLNLALHIQANPPVHIPNFTEAKLALLLSQIIVVASNNKEIVDMDGFVPLSSAILQRINRNYRLYLDYARATGILLEKSQFIRGKKSRNFKFHPQFEGKKIRYMTPDLNMPKFAKENFSSNIVLPRGLKFLSNPFDSGLLSIRYDLAKDFIERQYSFYLSHPEKVPYARVRGSHVRRQKNPHEIYSHAMYALDGIHEQEYWMSVDKTGGRCHSSLTVLPSLLRNFLCFNNESLVSIDVSCCQPYLINLLLSPEFYNEKNEKNPRISVNGLKMCKKKGKVRKKIEKEIERRRETIITLVNQSQTLSYSEIQGYQNLTTSGTFYPVFQQGLVHDGYPQFNDINEVKTGVLKMYYSDNNFTDGPKKWFNNHYPFLSEIISWFKIQDKSYLPILLQIIESEIMLNRIANRIHNEAPGVPFFTVHDSIITTIENRAYVTDVMREEFELAIGIPPYLKYDLYCPVNKKLLSLPYWKNNSDEK